MWGPVSAIIDNQCAVEAGERVVGRFEAQQIEYEAETFRRLQTEHIEPDIELARDLGFRLPRLDLKGAAHDLNERQERGVLSIGRTGSP